MPSSAVCSVNHISNLSSFFLVNDNGSGGQLFLTAVPMQCHVIETKFLKSDKWKLAKVTNPTHVSLSEHGGSLELVNTNSKVWLSSVSSMPQQVDHLSPPGATPPLFVATVITYAVWDNSTKGVSKSILRLRRELGLNRGYELVLASYYTGGVPRSRSLQWKASNGKAPVSWKLSTLTRILLSFLFEPTILVPLS